MNQSKISRSAFDRRSDDLCHLIGMILTDKLREVSYPGGSRLDHHQHLRVRVDLTLPLVDGAHPGDDVHTGRQLTTASAGGQAFFYVSVYTHAVLRSQDILVGASLKRSDSGSRQCERSGKKTSLNARPAFLKSLDLELKISTHVQCCEAGPFLTDTGFGFFCRLWLQHL